VVLLPNFANAAIGLERPAASIQFSVTDY